MKSIFLLIKLAWRGDLRLWQAFWIGKVVVCTALALATSALGAIFDSNLPGLLYALFMPFYLIFIFVAVWRCAPNTDHKIWMYLARAQIILIIISLILAIAFLYLHAE